MMNNLWKTLIVLSIFTGAVHCLTCRSCPFGLLGTCSMSKNVTCDDTTERCFTGEAKLNATEILTFHARGCLDSNLCGKKLTGTILGATYNASFQCCNTELCNGASSVHISLTVALSAALLSALWGTWEL